MGKAKARGREKNYQKLEKCSIIVDMNILMVTSEAVPFSKSGGLADVVGALPQALNNKKQDARIIVPAYNTTDEDAGDLVCTLEVPMLAKVQKVEIRQKTVNNVIYYFVCHPMYGQRLGIYGDTSFQPYEDNFSRFTVLCKASLMLCEAIGWKPDVIHCHDWTTGLVPYLLKVKNSQFFMGTKTIFTIHNLAYQGTFPRMDFLFANCKPNQKLFSNGQINMLQAGLVYADYITTVSPTYAKEIQTQAQGCGLESIICKRKNRLKGIINGIDTNEWNPQKDPLIPYHFSVGRMGGKDKLKAEIQQKFGLQVRADVPLFAMISRIASQKGFDLVLQCLEPLLKEQDIQFIIIGTGDSAIENALKDVQTRCKNLSVNILFSNKIAHLVEAGSDFFLMPSRYEPCGLNQLYSLRYGTIPIAHKTGGLADTIIDVDEYPERGTGLLFEELSAENIKKHILRAIQLYNRTEGNGCLKNIRKRAMEQDFSWEASAKEYIALYESILK
jgi:starch synthase